MTTDTRRGTSRGQQAVYDSLGDFNTRALEEVRVGDKTVDAVLARRDSEAARDRRQHGLDEPLLGDERAIYEWFAREDGRELADLLATSPCPTEDRTLVDSLRESGFLEKDAGGPIYAEQFSRPYELIAVEWAESGWQRSAGHPSHSRGATDCQWLIIDKDTEDDVDHREFEHNGIGLASVDEEDEVSVIVEARKDGPGDEKDARVLAEDIYHLCSRPIQLD